MEILFGIPEPPISQRQMNRFLIVTLILLICLGCLLQKAKGTTETRYLQKEDVDSTYQAGLRTDWDETAYEISVVQATANPIRNASWGIRVWLNNTATKLEYRELTSGTPVAVVSRTATNAAPLGQSATWACPESPLLNTTDALVVKWYAQLYYYNNGASTGWTEMPAARSRTEALSADYVNASTWTVTYFTQLTNDTSFPYASYARLAYDGNSDSADYYPTKIANFIYTPAAPSGTQLIVVVDGTVKLRSAGLMNHANGFEVQATLIISSYGNEQHEINVLSYSILSVSGVTVEQHSIDFVTANGLFPSGSGIENHAIDILADATLAGYGTGFLNKEIAFVLTDLFHLFDLGIGSHEIGITVFQSTNFENVNVDSTVEIVITISTVDDMPILFIGILTCFSLAGLCIVMMRRRKQG